MNSLFIINSEQICLEGLDVIDRRRDTRPGVLVTQWHRSHRKGVVVNDLVRSGDVAAFADVAGFLVGWGRLGEAGLTALEGVGPRRGP